MDQILKFIFENYSRFTAFDILALVIFAVLAIIGAFAFFKIVYSIVLSAQKNLIETQKEDLSTWKNRYSLLEEERNKVEAQFRQLAEMHQRLKLEYQKTSTDSRIAENVLRFVVPNLVSKGILLLQVKILFGTSRKLAICLEELVIYMEVRGYEKDEKAPSPWELYSRLKKASEELERLWRLLSPLGNEPIPKEQIVLSQDVLRMDTLPLEEYLSEVHNQISRVLDPTFKIKQK